MLFGTCNCVCSGEDGPSQMALEDLAMFRTIPTGTVFYPSDPVSMERAVELAANTEGIVFIRSSRPTSVCVYPMDEKFEVGKSKVRTTCTSIVMESTTPGTRAVSLGL